MNKSISEIEGWKWKGDIPNENSGYTEYRFYQLHDKKIKELSLSDIYFLILENSGLEYLVPIAINELKENIFLKADLYPGDLLSSLLSINRSTNYWDTHNIEKKELIKLYIEQKKAVGKVEVTDEIKINIKEDYKSFIS